MQFTDLSRLEKLKEDIDSINQLLEKAINDAGWLENADAESEIKSMLTDAKELIEIAFSDCEDEIDKIENPENWDEEEEEEESED
jgi:DNA replication initiation complex subunit (GINS family)